MSTGHRYADHAVNPRGRGKLPERAHVGIAGGSACGDMLGIGVVVERGTVVDAGFEATACGATVAAASAVVERVTGDSLLAAAQVGEAEIDADLGGLRPELLHATRLAADALHRALGAAAGDESATLAPPRADCVLVAMSGGVDSAVAALLVRESGHEAVGVTLQLWDDPGTDGTASCCSPQAVRQARLLAHSLGMPHFTVDLRDQFRTGVVDPYLAAFGEGLTPNPCVGCNGHVRFDALDRVRERLGAAKLVTGHYARVERDDDGPLLAAAADGAKDQTYMLAAVGPDLLDRLEFPLRDLTKPKVRAIARRHALAAADKPESQDLCFLAGIGRDDFLARHAGVKDNPGPIVDTAGAVLGEHPGAHRFTVGQRRGLGVAAPEPLYVLAVDSDANTVTVGPRGALDTRTVRVVGARLLRDASQVTHVKLRYRNHPLACRIDRGLTAGYHREIAIELDEPVDGAAPGQVACLLRGDTVVGWATIARPRPREALVSAGAAAELTTVSAVAGA